MHESDLIPRKFQALVDAELRPGERVVWFGQPIPWMFARRYVGVFLFGIFWLALLVFLAWDFLDGDVKGSALLPVLGFLVPFTLAGVAMLSSPFWMRRKARRTVYLITNQRAMLFDPSLWGSMTIRTFEPARLLNLRRVQHANGAGDLIFERIWTKDSDGMNQSTDHGFLAIDDVKTVEDIIVELVKPHQPAGG